MERERLIYKEKEGDIYTGRGLYIVRRRLKYKGEIVIYTQVDVAKYVKLEVKGVLCPSF